MPMKSSSVGLQGLLLYILIRPAMLVCVSATHSVIVTLPVPAIVTLFPSPCSLQQQQQGKSRLLNMR